MPNERAPPKPGRNDHMHLSAAGYDALRAREGVVMHYYDDIAGNCTWGVGTLAHYGPCTPEELQREVTPAQVDEVLTARVQQAEQAVRSIVRDVALTQPQFDAAVSFAYNSSSANTRSALAPANRGDMAAVAQHIRRNVYVHPRDRSGQIIGPPRLSQGLVNRRVQEQRPFLVEPRPAGPLPVEPFPGGLLPGGPSLAAAPAPPASRTTGSPPDESSPSGPPPSGSPPTDPQTRS